ncbi:hypothetical protein LV457_15000 [Mycobacterium sp. MYCO198283]|uniref:hypothetical protein n=1 Tax=Mycobacterium sp. MYCO198283 TaxID=2883505 RepID=UPI001E3F8FE8|nr:hypothetical protein [Mycobacterium sp. MYCO198283]MCG5433585.1 hypothetical protein [Mycobacterium sp. MYCO198283]
MTLHVEPTAAAALGRLCADTATDLAEQLRHIRSLPEPGLWLGDCAEGRGWGRLLSERTADLTALLDAHIGVLSAATATLRAQRHRYAAADHAAADRASRPWPQ